MTEDEAYEKWLAMPMKEAQALVDVAHRLIGPWEDDPDHDDPGFCDLPGERYWMRRALFDEDRVAVLSWAAPDEPGQGPGQVPRWPEETEEEYRIGFERQRAARPNGWFYWQVGSRYGDDHEIEFSGVATLVDAAEAAEAAMRRAGHRGFPSTIEFVPPPTKPLPWRNP